MPDVAPARAEREFPHGHAQRHDLLAVEPERLRALSQIRREALLRTGREFATHTSTTFGPAWCKIAFTWSLAV